MTSAVDGIQLSYGLGIFYQATRFVIIARNETIWSSHDTICIDTKGDDMIIYDTIRVVFVKIPISEYSPSLIYDHLED